VCMGTSVTLILAVIEVTVPNPVSECLMVYVTAVTTDWHIATGSRVGSTEENRQFELSEL
jgi:hypothetical protein